MHVALRETSHRPWPLPEGPWTWRQSWLDLLFAHWPIAAAAVRPLVPAALEVDECQGSSWIGAVPFRMTGVMRRPWPDLPGISAFPELNLRLYVRHGGRPGVFFLSLDATNPLAVWAARRFFHLPYFRACIGIDRARDGALHHATVRRARAGVPPARFACTYRPTGGVYRAAPGSLEHFLTERYCLYAQAPGARLTRTDVHHLPWPLQPAEAAITCNELAAPHGLSLSGPPASLCFSRRLDVIVWPPTPV